MKRLSHFVLAIGILFFAHAALADAAFQFAVPNYRVPRDPNVSGIRLSIIHGKNRSQRGLDFGLLSISETSTLSGLALVAGISRVTGSMSGGAAFSLINWHGGSDSGMNGAFVNILGDASKAFDVGFVTIADRETMVDLGGFNLSKRSTAQIGFVNVTDEIKGFQFGFLNIAKNGFLPVFPIVNFPKN